jgi:uncharacterized protein (TIGR02145 family)
MKIKATKIFILGINILIPVIMLHCERPENNEKEFPNTIEEINQSSKNAKRIGSQSSILVDNAISSALNQNGLVNSNQIANDIQKINGVISAKSTSSGAGIIVKTEDSIFLNILVLTKDDERLFKTTKSDGLFKAEIIASKSSSNYIKPNGSRKALILAPFQDSFKSDLDNISGLLNSAGYTVDQYINSEAKLNKFRGDFLNKYDIIYISTHGLADGTTRDGTKSTILLTRETWNNETMGSLTAQENRSIGGGTIPNGSDIYYTITVPWLNLTTTQNFTYSWIYADACESAKIDNGPASFSEAFLELGAEGYNGFDVSINNSVANPIAEKMFFQFTSGLSLTEASNKVRKDPILLAIKWTIGLISETFDVSSFDDNQLNSEMFYLFDPRFDYGTVTDNEGNIYRTIQIGNQTWMAENLNSGQIIDASSNQANNGIIEKYALGGDVENSTLYGGLYQWNEMMKYSVSEKSQGICPTGWHIPDKSDWEILLNKIASDGQGELQGQVLKSLSGWESGNGTDIYGFAAPPGGSRGTDGGFQAQSSWFWSSTPYWNIYIEWWQDNLSWYNLYDFNINAANAGEAVRCVKNN